MFDGELFAAFHRPLQTAVVTQDLGSRQQAFIEHIFGAER